MLRRGGTRRTAVRGGQKKEGSALITCPAVDGGAAMPAVPAVGAVMGMPFLHAKALVRANVSQFQVSSAFSVFCFLPAVAPCIYGV